VTPDARPVVVGLGGTPRSRSSTAVALRTALDAARTAGAQTALVDAEALQLPLYDPDAALTPEAESFLAEVQRADGLIIASPAYHGAPSSLVMNALDYIEVLRTDRRPYLDGRAVGCVVCASGWQAGVTTLVSLRSMVHALRGWPTPLGVAINSKEVALSQGREVTERIRAQLAILASQVVEFAVSQRHARR
jgi:FMN reductase